MTTQEKREFIDKFDDCIPGSNCYNASWQDTLDFAKSLKLINDGEYLKLLKLTKKFVIRGNDNNYILFINLFYNKIKNHQLKG